jgi:hypothetical protein
MVYVAAYTYSLNAIFGTLRTAFILLGILFVADTNSSFGIATMVKSDVPFWVNTIYIDKP